MRIYKSLFSFVYGWGQTYLGVAFLILAILDITLHRMTLFSIGVYLLAQSVGLISNKVGKYCYGKYVESIYNKSLKK